MIVQDPEGKTSDQSMMSHSVTYIFLKKEKPNLIIQLRKASIKEYQSLENNVQQTKILGLYITANLLSFLLIYLPIID